MQLKNKASIRIALAAATTALLSPVANTTAEAADSGNWVLNVGSLFYSEANRVSVFEPVLFATHNFNDEDYVSIRLVNDSMSGASPTGASVSNQTQKMPAHTSTGASGSIKTTGGNTISPNALPVNNFSDQRNTVSVDWQNAYTRTFRSIVGGTFSNENDYSSVGGSVTLQRDTENKLTTLTAGLSFSSDTVTPVGGAPVGLSLLSNTTVTTSNTGEDDDDEAEGLQKNLTDVMLGVTQVVSRRILTQLNYSVGTTSGYLTDPYKMVSRVDADTGDTLEYYSEKRPNSRLRQALFWKTVVHLPSDVVHFSTRYYWDDWDVKAASAEVKYHFNIGDHFYLMPSYRYYIQTGAKFFKYNILSTEAMPKYASADLRLAPLQSSTAGLKIGFNFSRYSSISLRAEYMQQWAKNKPTSSVSALNDVNFFPKLEVMMYTFQFSMEL